MELTDEEIVASLKEHEWIEFNLLGSRRGPYSTYELKDGLHAGAYLVRYADGMRASCFTDMRRVPAPEVK